MYEQFLYENDYEYANAMVSFFNKYVHISDEISICSEDDFAIQDLWSDGKTSKKGEKFSVPCDLIATNRVPLPNVRIIVDERGYIDGGTIIKFEVLLMPQEIIDFQKKVFPSKEIRVGIVKAYWYNKEVIVPFYMIVGVDSLMLSTLSIIDGIPCNSENEKDIAWKKGVISMLSTWYGIQIALLNPQTRNCFRGVSNDLAEHSFSKRCNQKKRSVHYIKKIYVKRGAIHKRIENHKKHHTLSWYVIGHWRHYKDGKTIFINGYWKGLLRDLQKNVDDGRNRIVNVPKTMEENK